MVNVTDGTNVHVRFCSNELLLCHDFLLAELFGIHNFYAGYTNNGVIQLLVSVVGGFFTCGASSLGIWIWAVIEGATKEVDVSGTPFGQ